LAAANCRAATVNDDFHFGPMSVKRFKVLQHRLSVKPGSSFSGYVESATYNAVINLVLDGILQSDGSKFCLPNSERVRPTGRVFADLIPIIDRGLRDASDDELLRPAIVKYLALVFPCPST
jgi:hypothetical protein